MGGINNGPDGNDEEREDERLDTKEHEAETAGLALEDIGVNAQQNPDDPSDPANFISADLDSQGQKNFTDGVEERHHGAGDRHGTILTHNMRGQGDDQLGGHISGTQASEIQKARLEIEEQRNENRARRIALLAAVGSISEIQTMQQFEQYYEQMETELATLEAETEVTRRELDVVTEELDQRIEDLRVQIARDQDRIVTLEPGSEERIQLAIKIRGAEHTLELYEEERKELAEQWDQHSGNLETAQQRMADIQRQIDAGASGSDLERLKAELQEAENAMTTANVSLDRLEQRVEFSEQLLDQSLSMQTAMTNDNSYNLFSREQLRSQADLAEYFLEVRIDGEMTLEELRKIEELRAAGGIDEAGLQRLESMEGEDAERAQTLATEMRAAQTNTLASIATSGIGVQVIGEDGQATDNYVYGEDAAAQLTALMGKLTQDSAAETQNAESVEYHVINPITNELSDRIDALRESRQAQTNGLPIIAGTEEVQATDALIELYENRRDQISADFEQYTVQMEAAQQKLDDLMADPDVTVEQLREAEQDLEAVKETRFDIQRRGQALSDTMTATEELTQDLEGNAMVCNMQGIGHAQLAQARVAAALIDRTDLTPEQRATALKEAGDIAFEENKFEFNFDDFNLELPPLALENIEVPPTEIIGSAEDTNLGGNTSSQWDATETLDLGTTEADMAASQRIQAMIEGGKITESNLDQAIEMLDVDRETIERRLAEQGVEVLKPDADNTNLTASIFFDDTEPEPQMASYQSIPAAGPGSIQVPYTPIADATVTPTDIAPSNFGSFADNELDKYGPPLAGQETPTQNSAPDSGTALTAFSSTPTNTGATPGQPSAPQAPTASADTSAADAVAQRERELQLAEEQARLAQQNNDNVGSPGGAPQGGGGSTIT